MDPKRVLIVNVQSLLLGGVESLLGANGKFILIGTSSDNPVSLIRKITLLKPDVVIINEDEITSYVEPGYLITSLLNTQDLRLIVLNSRNNVINIYEKQAFAISNSNQLLRTIQGNPSIANFEQEAL